MSISESCEDESAFCINHLFSLSLSLCPPPPPSTQITVIQAHELNIIPPFDIVVLQSHSDASQLITLCTLKYTNACVRSFVNELLFNYNFTWTLLISGANRVSPSAHNYSGYNCSACLWNMLISQRGHRARLLCQILFENAHEPLNGFRQRLLTGQEALDGQQALKLSKIISSNQYVNFFWSSINVYGTQNMMVSWYVNA